MITEKKCPLCKTVKDASCFGKYFSKERNKYRLQNYCNTCTPKEKTRRAKEYYERNTEKVKTYQKKRRADPEKRPILKEKSQEFKVKYRETLQDCYLVDQMKQKIGLTTKQIRDNPELIEAYRAKILLKRAIKQSKNEQHK